MAQGPLAGVKIVEFAGIGPCPFCGMLLSDMGADVVRIDRAGKPRPGNPADVMSRGRRSIALNLKDEADREIALKLLEQAEDFGNVRPPDRTRWEMATDDHVHP